MTGAISAAEYLFQRLGQGLDLSALDGQARLADLALPYIRTIPDGVLRELTMERLATIAKKSPEALQSGAQISKATTAWQAPPDLPGPFTRYMCATTTHCSVPTLFT